MAKETVLVLSGANVSRELARMEMNVVSSCSGESGMSSRGRAEQTESMNVVGQAEWFHDQTGETERKRRG